jgi:hypothetical protein
VTRSSRCLILASLLSLWPFATLKARTDAVARPNGDLRSVQESESNFTLEGKVTQKSEGKLTVSTQENIVFHVRYDDKTDTRLKDGAQGSGQDLNIGLTITAQGAFNKSGEVVAHQIQVH